MKLFIGLMSGTSMDGIDAALVDVTTNTLIHGLTKPYTDKTKQLMHSILKEEKTALGILSQLDTLLGQEFAQAVNELIKSANVAVNDVVAIGSHGQTICHDATADIPYTVQLGCGHTIAELTGITVVADFRTRNVVTGGQGAPFAPIYHQALFGSKIQDAAIVNVGGIANITMLSNGEISTGYDVGPGNCLLDAWIQKSLGEPYDTGGQWASTGEIIEPLLSSLLSDSYFERKAPKSIGKEYFSLDWLSQHLQPNYAKNDIQATLLALTTITIKQALQEAPTVDALICGGGTHNTALLKMLVEELPEIHIDTTQALGVNPDFLEAMMFAWLADKTLNKTHVDLTKITGAKKDSILGAIYLSNHS